MKFCSECGSAQIQTRVPEGDGRPRLVCGDCGTIHYQNPRLIVGCLVIHDGKMLLLKRTIEPRANKWNLPAGFMENGETVMAGAAREVWEEANAEVEIIKLHSVYTVLPVHQVHCVFLAKLKTPHFSAGAETSEAELFDLDAIPFDELAFHSNHFAIRAYLDNPNFEGVHFGEFSMEDYLKEIEHKV